MTNVREVIVIAVEDAVAEVVVAEIVEVVVVAVEIVVAEEAMALEEAVVAMAMIDDPMRSADPMRIADQRAYLVLNIKTKNNNLLT